MADNTVEFKVDVKYNDGTLKSMQVSLEGVDEISKKVNEQVQKFNTGLLDLNQGVQALESVQNAIESLGRTVHNLTGFYQAQLIAETQLETIMRQRMNSSNEEIASIKELASQQQALGVIGDEVTLSGAQQLATFLNQKASLDTLIPAMDNLIAQQNGLNATQQDAVSIGNMMGKAMQGSTTVLQRVGITFTDAQEQMIKYGTEEQRAATLAQVITDNVGEMNKRLAETDAGRMKQAENTMGDLKEVLGGVLQQFEPLLTHLAEFGSASIGVLRLVQVFNAAKTAINQTTIGASLLNIRIKECAAAQNILGISANTAKIAVYGLNAALTLGIGVGISLLVEKIAELITGAKEATETVDEASNSSKQYADVLADAQSRMKAAIGTLEKWKGSKSEEAQKVKELNDKYGESFGFYNSVKDWYKVLTEKSALYCQQMVNEAKIRGLANQAAEAHLDNTDVTRQMKKMEESGTAYENKLVPKSGTGYGPTGATEYETVRVMTKAYAELSDKIRDNNQKYRDSNKEIRDLTSNSAKLAIQMKSGGGEKKNGSDGGNTIKTNIKIDPESIADLEKQLQELKEKQNKAGSLELAIGYNPGIKELEDKIAYLKTQIASNGPIKLMVTLDTKGGLGDLDGISEKMQGAKKMDFDPYQLKQPATYVNTYVKSLNDAKKKQEEMTKGIRMVGNAFSGLGRDIGGQAGQWLEWGGNVAQATAQAISSINALLPVQKTSTLATQADAGSKAANSVAGIPIVGAAMAVAAVASVLAAFAGLPKFADGGLAYGPSLGIFGEYAGASNNPEVIAPLDKLQNIIGGSAGSGGGTVEFRIEGRTLVGILSKMEHINRRTR